MEQKIFPKKSEIYYCKTCDYKSSRLYDFNKHIKRIRHLGKNSEAILLPDGSEISQITRQKFYCETCNFTTQKNSHYQNHIKTKKHLSKTIVSVNEKEKIICVNCEKQFARKWNLSIHEVKCKQKPIEHNPSSLITQETFLEFMKQSKEFQNILIQQNELFMKKTEEQSKQIIELTNKAAITNNITNRNMTNSINKQFNIQLFLNDQCKDAINIMDFVESLQVQLSDLEKTGEIGYVNGITRILVNGLNKLDVCKRPIHCTDIKRETVYIKDENVWEKDDVDKSKLKKAVNRVSQLNLRQLKNWQEQNPEYEDLTSKVNDDFIKLSTNAIGSCSTEEDGRNKDKIMKNVLKEVVIERREPTVPFQTLP